MCFLLFFRQKTAYEMRISDWSSDVCSSDLAQPDHDRGLVFRTLAASALRRGMVAFRGRHGSLPEAAHPTVEGSRPGARRHVAHAAVAARPGLGPDESRSDERRVGKEGVSTGRSRWSPVP